MQLNGEVCNQGGFIRVSVFYSNGEYFQLYLRVYIRFRAGVFIKIQHLVNRIPRNTMQFFLITEVDTVVWSSSKKLASEVAKYLYFELSYNKTLTIL